jgi:electron transfer flavoprotein beta subunit
MAAKSKPVDVLSVGDIGVPADQVGSSGAGQEITEISKVADRGGGEIVVDDGDGAERILTFLKELKVV